MPPVAVEDQLARVRDALTTASSLQFSATLTPNANPRDIEVSLVPLARDAERTRFLLLTMRDLTERIKTERQLRESEIRFDAVSDSTQDVQILFAVDAKNDSLRVAHINRAAREEFARLFPGAQFFNPVGVPVMEAALRIPGITPGLLAENIARLREGVTTKRTIRFQNELSGKAGRRVAEVTITPITNERGVVTHLLRTSADITARVAAEQQQRQFSESLERRVNERTLQLAEANRELEAFTYSVSHDLRAPLRSIEGFSAELLDSQRSTLSEATRAYIERIHTAGQRMKGLLENLLRLSRLPTSALTRDTIDLSTMAAEILAELQNGEPHRRVATRIEPRILVFGDTALMQIALQNLLHNAWKYTAKRTDAEIAVGQLKRDGAHIVFVRDNGAGFDPAFAAHLFAPFQRLHKSEEFEGVGIGLATVRRVIVAHGGRVWAESRPGSGATFYFTLTPAETPPASVPPLERPNA